MAGLQMTPGRLVALRAVRDGAVVCHSAGAHVPGWGWSVGGDVTVTVQESLSELHHARLIDVDRSGRWHVDGDPVALTRAGVDRLAWWASRSSVPS